MVNPTLGFSECWEGEEGAGGKSNKGLEKKVLGSSEEGELAVLEMAVELLEDLVEVAAEDDGKRLQGDVDCVAREEEGLTDRVAVV